MNRVRKAESETTMTATLDFCCCQNVIQIISTSPLASLMPDILTIATSVITIDRHKEGLRANFWRSIDTNFPRKYYWERENGKVSGNVCDRCDSDITDNFEIPGRPSTR